MSTRESIFKKLDDALHPSFLDVADDSHHHAGHSGNPGGGSGTHFSIVVVADAFRGKSRVECHRLINTLLADDLAGTVHALAITAKAPHA